MVSWITKPIADGTARAGFGLSDCARGKRFLQQQLAGTLASGDATIVDFPYCPSEQILLKRGQAVLITSARADKSGVQGNEEVDLVASK